MSENQNIEWKENWRDEYLKWICGFANAAGGKIYIGTDDNGRVVGVADAKKLLEDIPNKVRDVLGIMVDVNLLEENGLQYIEIDVPPYSNPWKKTGCNTLRLTCRPIQTLSTTKVSTITAAAVRSRS